MAKPAVAQFEVTGKDSAALKRFYVILEGDRRRAGRLRRNEVSLEQNPSY
jgi:hypothetical protein